MDKHSRIFVAGHRGLVGSAIVRRLTQAGYDNLLLAGRADVDLRDQRAVDQFFERERPEYVFLAAAKVGGILANSTYPADFLRDNLAIQTNVIESAHRHRATKLAFLGSSCIYPKLAPQPIKEEYLLTGPLEPTNEWYAIAKIAGIKMAQAYHKQFGFRAISLMPTNSVRSRSIISTSSRRTCCRALMRKAHEAKLNGSAELTVWGSGSPRREFLHVDDLADASLFLMRNYEEPDIVNVGTGEDLTIRELAELVQRVTGFEGRLVFDAGKPDGTPRKLLDVSRLTALGWKARIRIEDGIASTYSWFLNHHLAGSARLTLATAPLYAAV